jgi:hypothetical protein
MKTKRRPRAAERRLAWAIRGGKHIDVDGSVYFTGYLGSVVPGVGSQGLYATRSAARKAMNEGPKKVHPRAMNGKDWCAWPNARVERVEIIVRPARRRA